MKLILVPICLCLGLACASAAAPASVSVTSGNVIYHDAGGATLPLTSDGKNSDAVLSPDGKSLAFVKLLETSSEPGTASSNQLWMCTLPDQNCKILLNPFASAKPEDDLSGLEQPVFSLKGNFIYVLTAAYATSYAIHQVNVATGTQKFVAAANSLKLIENGRYAGDLLVGQHVHGDGPGGGSEEAVNVIDPTGKVLLKIGSGEDDTAMQAWVSQNHVALRP